MTIQWFPGHMAKAIRKIKELSSQIDIIVEVLDARAPYASRNPVLEEMLPEKPRLIILNKSDLCDSSTLGHWVSYYKKKNIIALPINAVSGKESKKIEGALKTLFENSNKNTNLKFIRIVIFGIPNVGKSTLINYLIGKRIAKAADKPGVTKKQTWQNIGNKFSLLDTPGILWPKFEDPDTGRKLAAINCIKENNFQAEEIAFYLCDYIMKNYPETINKRFKLEGTFSDALQLFEAIGKKRGCFISGNEIDLDRVYDLFIREFRSGKLGRISLEKPENALKQNNEE